MAKETYRMSQGRAREGQERGRGIPRTDIERVMNHYGVDEKTACEWLAVHSVEELLPERGSGLAR